MSDESAARQSIELRFPSVTVFERPDTHSRQLQELHRGDPFEVFSEQEPVSTPEGEFCQVRLADGRVGFVYAPNLIGPVRPLSREERAAAFQPAPLRPGRSASLEFLFNPLAAEEWQLWTPLSLAQCQARLQAVPRTDLDSMGMSMDTDYTPAREYPVRAQATAQGFWLETPHYYRSWVAPTVADVRLIPGADGTHVVARLSGTWLQSIAATLTVLVALAAWGVFIQSWMLLLTLIPIGLVMFGGSCLGRYMARHEGQVVLDFLVETLRVEERPLPPGLAPR